MKLVEFTYNKNQILVDADSVLKVIAAKPQEFDDTGMSRQEYWKTRGDRVVHRATRLVFKNAAENPSQYIDQTADEARDKLTAAHSSLIPAKNF